MAKKHSNSGRHTFFMCILFLMAAAAITMSAIVLKRMLDDEDEDKNKEPSSSGNTMGLVTKAPAKEPSSTKTRSTPLPDSRAGVIVDCDPPNYRNKTRASKGHCERMGCTWRTPANKKAPTCIFTNNIGYEMTEDPQMTVGNTKTALIRRKGRTSVYGMDIASSVKVDIVEFNENALRIYLRPNNNKSFEIPEEVLKMDILNTSASSGRLYEAVFVTYPVFGVRVTRKSTNTVVFDTALPGLTFSEQFMQITTRLPSDNVYGFGEHNHKRYRHDMNWKTWSIFTRDAAPTDPWNLYSAHPVYMNLETDGNSNMVFLKNSNAMEVTLQPAPYPAITYRTVGGVFDFYIFMGPSPKEALQQYIKAIGLPLMPPYWALGFHICRWGYGNLTQMRKIHKRNVDAGVPFDAQWGDIDYMYKKFDFTYDRNNFNGLPDFVKEVHDEGKKFVIIVDSGIGANETLYKEAKMNSPGYSMYEDGLPQPNGSDVYVKAANGSVIVGKVWPGRAVFPDFTDLTKATAYWKKWIQFFKNNESVKVDGLWIDMDEPASFVPGSEDGCNNNTWNHPPFIPRILEGDKDGGSMYYKTLCMDAEQKWGRHYDVHSLYGHSKSMVTYRAMTQIEPNKRPFIMTRSSFAGTSKYSHKWLGDNGSLWSQMYYSIIGMLEFQLFGFPMIGADICGFWDPTEYEMCIRWYQLGTFYPFSRSHNMKDMPDQDPTAFDQRFTNIVRHYILLRYKFIPYMYTLFKQAHTEGKMVLRSLMFEFPHDKKAWSIDRQFMMGPSLLISPVLEPNKTTVDAYFPKGHWFDYYEGHAVYSESGKVVTLDAPLSKLNIHGRGGSIIPFQNAANSTKYSRLNPMGLWISLDEYNNAKGSLYMDDGESLDSITAGNYLELEFELIYGETLDIKVVHNGYTPPGNLNFTIIEFYGLISYPTELRIDNVVQEARHIRSKFNRMTVSAGKLHLTAYIIQLIDIELDITKNHTIQWTIF